MTSERTHLTRCLLSLTSIFFAAAVTSPASSIFLGFNTATPVQLYSLSGKYMQDVGPSGAIATFPDGLGNYFSVAPSAGFTDSQVTEYNANFAETGSFTIGNLVTDGNVYKNELLFSAYDGTVYRTTDNGTILSSWNTGFSHAGVASDGSFVYTTEGDGGNLIDVWTPSGTSVRQIATPFVGLYGLGYDSSTGDFWASGTNFVYQLSASGSLLNTFDIPGDSRTPDGAIHDSLSIGSLANPVPPPVTTPEPASIFLFICAGFLLFLWKLPRFRTRMMYLASCVLCFAGASLGSVEVKLTTSVASGAPVGTTVGLLASASDTANRNASFTYQFSVGAPGSSLQVRRDFYTYNSFPWTPTDSEGVYELEVVVHSSSGATGSASAAFEVTSRVSGNSPVITRTSHPLVALYSMPPCPSGNLARVRFKLSSDVVWQATSPKTCNGHTSVNFYIAGMRGSTPYQLQQDVFNGPFARVGPLLTFTTGAIPAGLPITEYVTVKPSPAPNSTAYPVLLSGPLGKIPYATDTNGRLIWFLPNSGSHINSLVRPQPGGTLFVIVADTVNTLLREYDLAGNLVRETNSVEIAAQLKAHGADPITAIHHDAIRLPSGDIAFFGSVEKVANQGAGDVDVLGDQVVIVDSNLQVRYWWNEFDHLDVMRPAVLGETCGQNQAGCPHLFNNYPIANDWTHSNALAYAPDGNILVSSRHQDWIMKFRYENGSGDGALLWRLGNEGDFRASTSVVNPWFSHQHNVEVEPSGQLSLFDNGNTRITHYGGNSRGQAWRLDESSKVATLVVNLDLGAFSQATGSAQLLSNGNYTFNLGYTGSTSSTKEYTPSNTLEAEQIVYQNSYRSFRMRSLYTEY